MEELKALASNTKYQQYKGRDTALLEKFPTPSLALTVNITAPEFTCLCPKTGQPDFATIIVRYKPNEWCVESKSLKLYLMSFRDEGIFHEACVTEIGLALVSLLAPVWLEVVGEFAPRGGISFHPTFNYTA